MSFAEVDFDLFLYTPDEQRTFPYLGEYMRRILPHLSRLRSEEPAARRLLLAGLFLSWRAFGHRGQEFSTEQPGLDPRDILERRLLEYRRITGDSIAGGSDYLERIGLNPRNVPFHPPGEMLARFVLQPGKP